MLSRRGVGAGLTRLITNDHHVHDGARAIQRQWAERGSRGYGIHGGYARELFESSCAGGAGKLQGRKRGGGHVPPGRHLEQVRPAAARHLHQGLSLGSGALGGLRLHRRPGF
jgi:hypothetical protein